MTIDPTVRGMAVRFGLDPMLVQAVVQAEGGTDAIVRAVQCSFPSVQTLDKALDIVCRSAVHAMSDYLASVHGQAAFVQFWGKRWAPVGVANDPHGLNANWPGNVTKAWGISA